MKLSTKLYALIKSASIKETAEFLGLPLATAERVRKDCDFGVRTAYKITRAFPQCPPEELFRRPHAGFVRWLAFVKTEGLEKDGMLVPYNDAPKRWQEIANKSLVSKRKKQHSHSILVGQLRQLVRQLADRLEQGETVVKTQGRDAVGDVDEPQPA